MAVALLFAGSRVEPQAGANVAAVSGDPTPTDHHVIEAALVDLLTCKELALSRKRPQIVVHNRTLSRPSVVIRFAFTRDMREDIPPAVLKDMESRNTKERSLAGLRPAHPDVLVRDIARLRAFGMDDALLDAFPRARAGVTVCLPGYSKDGRTAALCFPIRPANHPAMGAYVLVKDGDVWNVKRRYIQYFA